MNRISAVVAVLMSAFAALAEARQRAPEPPYAAQLACHRSMGGSFDAQRRAVLPSRYGGAEGRFVFTGDSVVFQAADGANSGAGVIRALNTALVRQAHAVESFDPGSYNSSRCPELVRVPVPGDH